MPTLFLTADPVPSRHAVAPIVERDFRGQGLPAGAIELPVLEASAASAVLEQFNDLVTQLARSNTAWDGWWYTWLSARDRHNSRLFDQVIFIERVRTLLKSNTAPALTLCCADPILSTVLAGIGHASGWQVRVGVRDRVRWLIRRIGTRFVPFIAAMKLIRRGIMGLVAARRNPHETGALVGREVVFASLIGRNAIPSDGGSFHDTYFGMLPHRFAYAGVRTLVLGHPDTEITKISGSVARWDSPSICTPSHVTGLRDLLVASLKAAFVPRGATRIDMPQALSLTTLIRADLRRDTVSRGFGYLLERAMARILAQNPDARVLHMYENNPWERAVARAARAASPPRTLQGYLHCAVLPAHLKNYIAPEEVGLRPAPDTIICTGPAARDVFLRLGAHDPHRVHAGCALRDSGTRLANPRAAPPKRIRTVLVLLEGLEKMIGLLRFTAEAALRYPEIRFVARAHPALPLARLATLAGVSVGGPNQIQASAAPGLREGLEGADAVLYQGTTAAMTAGYLGIPLIRFAGQEILTDDPLFACPNLKREVSTPEELPSAFGAFETMDGPTWRHELATLRAYIDEYLAPVTDENLAAFGVPGQRMREAAIAASG